MADRHEQRALVDRVDDRAVVLDGDDLEVRLRLVEVAHRREVRLLVDDAVARARVAEAREDDHLRDGDVLVHDDRAGGRADDPPDLVADGDGMSHQPSPQERMPRSRHMRAYSSSRSSAAAGIAASEWLIR